LTQIYGEGEYQVRILDGVSCRISSTFEYKIPVIEKTTRVLICDGDLYDFGDRKLTDAGSYTYTFKNINNCDSIVSLDLEIIGAKYDTLEVSILKGETYNIENNSFSEEGNFPLTLTSSIGCDSLVLLKLTHFDVFIPNVFSPNQDGQNDVFAPISLPGKIVSVVMSIYDRWGNLVHKGEEWDGSGIDVGVYIYLLDINFNFGKSKIFSGSVTVVR
jgi:gliding motility-associated-like protein